MAESNVILSAWNAIGASTPMAADCGALCGAACCHADEDDQGGVALLPRERALMGEIDWGEIAWDAGMRAEMLVCARPCDRAHRPFLCRVFPLCPVVGKSGKWTVRMDARARAVCPLSRAGLKGLDPAFVRGAAEAARILAQDPTCADFLARWAQIEAEFRKPLF